MIHRLVIRGVAAAVVATLFVAMFLFLKPMSGPS